MPSLQPKELLVSKVTKESLEDIAKKEAKRVARRLPWLLLIAVGILILAFFVPSTWWWGLVPAMFVFAGFFLSEQRRLETLQGRAAGSTAREARNSGRAYP